MGRKVSLVGGVLSSLLYVIGIDVIAALRYPDYHQYRDQMVSEFIAARAPTRRLMVWLFIPYKVLVFGLAVGFGHPLGANARRASQLQRSPDMGLSARRGYCCFRWTCEGPWIRSGTRRILSPRF